MKIKVDAEKCQGHGRCYALAPDVFTLDDRGYLVPGDVDVQMIHVDLAKRAVRACPERALTIEGE